MNKKGFTLIELLAVIVILAIIALIATPIILNVIDTARKGAKESSTLGYIDAVEKQVMMSQVDTGATRIPAGTYTVEQLTNLKVDIKGEKPDSTSVVTISNKGAVSEGWFTYDNGKYKIYYNGNKAVADTEDYVDENGNKHNTIPESGSSSSGPTKDLSDIYSSANVKQKGVKGIVYLDPTNLSATCNAENSVSTTGTKTGCMKWYIYDDSGSTYKMILDHNTTAVVDWVNQADYEEAGGVWTSENSGNKGPLTANKQLAVDTQGWSGNPRLISGEEIAAITTTTDLYEGQLVDGQWYYFDGTGNYNQYCIYTTKGSNPYAWLFNYSSMDIDYTCEVYGCDITDLSTAGYWTSSLAPH